MNPSGKIYRSYDELPDHLAENLTAINRELFVALLPFYEKLEFQVLMNCLNAIYAFLLTENIKKEYLPEMAQFYSEGILQIVDNHRLRESKNKEGLD